MIVVKEKDGSNFKLLTNRHTDGNRHGSRSALKTALLNALRGQKFIGGDSTEQESELNAGIGVVVAHNRRDFDTYSVYVSFNRGSLELGCKNFGRKATQQILRWAGITPSQVVAARRIARRVRNSQ